MGMGAELMAKKYEACGACTHKSAPTPSTRLAVSFTRPDVMPTTSMTMPTSMATARTLTMVRMGRCRRLARTILFSIVDLGPGHGAQFHQFRAFRFLQLEFIGGNLLVESRFLNRNAQPVIFRRACDLNLRGITCSLKILVVGVLNVFGIAASGPVGLHSSDIKIRPVKPDFSHRKQFGTASRLKNGQHVKPA